MSKPQFNDWNIAYEEFLYTKALETNAQLVYEVGVREGYSTQAILWALERTGGRLISCDIKEYRPVKSERWTFIQTDSAHFPLYLDEKADMIYIDGDHSYSVVRDDVVGLWPLLKTGGLMVLDDTQTFPHGPGEIIKQLQGAGFDAYSEPVANGFGMIHKREEDPDSADIVMVCWNHLDLTRRAVQSIRDSTAIPYRLIVSDGASTDGTGEWLAAQNDIIAITAETNEGIEPATNRALRISTAPYIVLIGNDVVVSKGWLKLLIDGLTIAPEAGFITAIEGAGPARAGPGDVQTKLQPPGTTCVVLRRKVIEEVGLFDERFAFSYNGDSDYCYRMKLAGWKFAYHYGVHVQHDKHSTIGATGKKEQYVALGKQRFHEKYPDVSSVAGNSLWYE